MHRLTHPILRFMALASVPLSAAWLSNLRLPSEAVAASHSTPTKKYKGPSVDMRWGTVQVTILVKSKTIKDVKATAPEERERSAIVNQQALPLLRQEVLKAQSASIDTVSGATLTSDAYTQSLEAAIKKAHLKKSPPATPTTSTETQR